MSNIKFRGMTMTLNLSKLLGTTRTSRELLTPSGGVVSGSYFQYLHEKKKQQPHSLGTRYLLTSIHRSNENDPSSSSITPELKEKLERLKEKLGKNVYFEKYKEKFQQLELTSPKELLAKLELLDARISGKGQDQGGEKNTKKKTQFLLNDVMALDRIKDLEKDDIIFLWQEFHRRKEGVLAAVMAGAVFDKMVDLATQYPMFLMPLPRSDGYEFLFVQYMDKAFHFTPLLVYQTHKENAPECLRLINYSDLQASKDLVLMRGEFDKNLLTAKDAHIMAVQVNFYYGETTESRRKLLEIFSLKPESFKHMDLIDEYKNLQQSHPHLFEFEE